MAKFVVNSESLISVADAIRGKCGTEESLEFPSGFVDAVNAIESGGGDDTNDFYRNIIQEALYKTEGSGSYYQMSIFKFTSITDVSMFDFSKVKTFSGAFLGCMQLLKVVVDVSGANTMSQMCLEAQSVKTVEIRNMTSKITSIDKAFFNCHSLESLSTLDVSGCTGFGGGSSDYSFGRCHALKEIRFAPECIKYSIHFVDSPLLSQESVQSIIDGLAWVDVVQHLTLNSQVVVTDSQKQAIYNKGWTLILN